MAGINLIPHLKLGPAGVAAGGPTSTTETFAGPAPEAPADNSSSSSSSSSPFARLRALADGGNAFTLDDLKYLFFTLFGIAAILYISPIVVENLTKPTEAELKQTEARLQGEVAKLEVQVKQTEALRNEIKSFEAQMAEVQKKLTLIESTGRNRNLIVRMIDFLVNEMPNNVWLTRTGVDGAVTDSKITVEGYALSLQNVSEFVKKLEGAVFFPVWDVVETTAEKSQANAATPNVQPIDAKKFQISAKVKAL